MEKEQLAIVPGVGGGSKARSFGHQSHDVTWLLLGWEKRAKDLPLPMPGKEIGTIMLLLNVGRCDVGAQVFWRYLYSVSMKWNLPAGHLWGMSSFSSSQVS